MFDILSQLNPSGKTGMPADMAFLFQCRQGGAHPIGGTDVKGFHDFPDGGRGAPVFDGLDDEVEDNLLTRSEFSAHGPILPINSQLLALTPISAFRPRGWRGAILPHQAKVTITIHEAEKRPVAAVADHVEVRHVREVEIAEDRKRSAKILFDPGHSLAERVLREQFRF